MTAEARKIRARSQISNYLNLWKAILPNHICITGWKRIANDNVSMTWRQLCIVIQMIGSYLWRLPFVHVSDHGNYNETGVFVIDKLSGACCWNEMDKFVGITWNSKNFKFWADMLIKLSSLAFLEVVKMSNCQSSHWWKFGHNGDICVSKTGQI